VQNRALMRLLLRVQAESHGLLRGFLADTVGVLAETVDAEGLVDGVGLVQRLPSIEVAFRAMWARWTAIFEAGRVQAASIPWGGYVVMHNSRMGIFEEGSRGGAEAQRFEEREIDGADVDAVVRLWQGRRERALAAGAQRIGGDGLQLSQRIWRLESQGLERIRATLLSAMGERTSARELAKLLEPVLGAGQDCPRWSMQRLYGMTAGERSVSRAGLFSGEACAGQGIAYNALRLARTELQYAHHAMASEIYANSPWVTGKWVRLSPAHPKIDICDSYAGGGPYESGDQILPLHPNCMCYYEAALMDVSDFRRQVRGWVAGENGFLDGYRDWSGFDPLAQLPWVMGLADALELWLGQDAAGHAEALGL